MKLSIIIPAFNLEDYIERCLESILEQAFVDFEIIIVNDGSSDKTLDICKLFANRDNRINIFTQENSGVSVARNVGLKVARGEWVCFVDGDDWIAPDSFGKIFANDSLDCDIAIARCFVNDGTNVAMEKYRFPPSLGIDVYGGLQTAVELNYFRGSIWGVFYKRDFIMKNNIFFPLNIRNGEDTIFFSLSTIYAQRVRFLEVEYYYVFEREGSASRSWNFERVINLVKNIRFINLYIDTYPSLSTEAAAVLNYNIYRVVSIAYNELAKCFSINNFMTLTRELKKEIRGGIDIGKIKQSRKKVELANFSLYMYGISVIFKSIKSSSFQIRK